MRAFAASIIALGLFAMPAMAAGGAANNNGADPASPKAADPAAKPAPKPANTAANAAPASPARPAAEEMETELQQLRDAVAMQAQQIQDQQKKMQQLEEQLKSSGAARENLSASPAAAPAATAAPVSTASLSATAAASPAEANQAGNNEPASWRFKGVTFTPIGFFAAETVWRQRALSADVNTPFNGLPMPGASQYNISEFNASGRQSRIGMLVQGKLDTVKIGGYYEADFLSAGVTSNDNQSNSYTLRQRQFWAQAAFDSGLTITGGQMWSLVTQTTKGMDNRTENLPETIDAQYHVGFSWERQYGFRVVKDFGNKLWVGASVEEPQTIFKYHGTATPFLLGTAGNGGGLYNATTNYSFNYTPDFVFKAVFEPGFGHYEVFGILSTFRDRVFPTGATPFNSSVVGGGGGANAWLPFDHSHINLGAHFLMGNGVGRYGTSGLPDATVQPDGALSLLRSYQGLGTLAFHYPKWDVYLNAGGEFAGRRQFISGSSLIPNEGYGALGFDNSGCWTETNPGTSGYAPGSLAACTGDIRNILEATIGTWYTFYNGPKGQMKFGLQFSHEVINTWTGLGPTGVCASATHPNCGPSPDENMFFTSFRYYIP
jgi:TolA-binding protein